jgi:SnoaL-like domain
MSHRSETSPSDVLNEINRAFTAADIDGMLRFYDESSVFESVSVGEVVRGKDAFRARTAAVFAAHRDMDIEMRWMLESDDEFAGEMIFAATNCDSRERLFVPIMFRQRYLNGLIVEEREYFGELTRGPVPCLGDGSG